MKYPIKTIGQLPLILKAFRKERGLTQADMGEKLGVTQQTYASFEANPATATLARLFKVLRLLAVEISLDQISSGTVSQEFSSSTTYADKSLYTVKKVGQKRTKAVGNVTIQKAKKPNVVKAGRVVVPARKKEHW